MKSEHPQSFFKAIGDNACYVLCIINIAEQYLHQEYSIENKLYYITQFIKYGYVRFNSENCMDQDNFFVENPCAMLRYMTYNSWSIEKKDASEVTDVPQYAVEQWKKGGIFHFARRYIGFDPLQYSNTVASGKIVSYRVFKPLD